MIPCHMTLLTTNQIHAICCQGQFYNASDAIIDYAYLTRYLDHYENIQVLVRTRHVSHVDETLPRLDGDRVHIVALPDPGSPLKALVGLPAMIRDIKKAAEEAQAYFLKMPDVLGTLVGLTLWWLKRDYAVEVVADSYEGIRYAKKGMPGCQLYARLFDRLTQFIVSRASTVTYISRYLQNRYPHPNSNQQFVFCSVDISEKDRGQTRTLNTAKVTPFHIVAAGRLSAEKGHVYLIRAMKKIIEGSACQVTLDLLGEGPERPALEAEVLASGLGNYVKFRGYVKHGDSLNHCLDRAQLYVLPSLTEGMGRGLIEAMARGIPCVATAVGGVPEYLDHNCLVDAGDPEALADKILQAIHEPETLVQWSEANVEATQAFSPERLQGIKTEFWSAVKLQSSPL